MKLVITLLVALLTACATKPPAVVKVPVMVKCRIIIPPEPHYPIQVLKQGDSVDLVAKSYDATVKLQQAHIKDIEARIKPCL